MLRVQKLRLRQLQTRFVWKCEMSYLRAENSRREVFARNTTNPFIIFATNSSFIKQITISVLSFS